MHWGSDITIITAFDTGFFPGFCGLYNSARCNEFEGSFLCLNSDIIGDEFSISYFVKTEFRQFKVNSHDYSYYVNWLIGLKDLPVGNYLYLDCDTIIERPLGFHLKLINEAPIVSTESGRKYDPFDVLTARQCIETGLSTDLKAFPYINDGFFAFQIPRDKHLIEQWINLSLKHLKGVFNATENPKWFFAEQDILNILLRQPYQKVFSISPNQIEIDDIDQRFRSRAFPWKNQSEELPKDKLKYIIHGAGLRRPWINNKKGWKYVFEKYALSTIYRRLRKKTTPYERAWAYYACSNKMPINKGLWEKHFNINFDSFTWKQAFNLK